MRKTLTVIAVMILVSGPGIRTAHAQWVVTDPGNTIQNIVQVVGQITQISNEAAQIVNQYNQINNQLQQLQRIAGGDFSAIAGLAAQQNADLGNLLASATTLQYSLATVQAEINTAYPQGDVQWGAIPNLNLATVNARRAQWDALITEAGSTAARAQTSLDRIQNRNTYLGNLMASANAEDGDVRQAQIGNQINGTLAQGVNDLIAVQTTNSRLLMIESQTAVAERELAREQNRRAMAGFTDTGPVAVPLTAFPDVR